MQAARFQSGRLQHSTIGISILIAMQTCTDLGNPIFDPHLPTIGLEINYIILIFKVLLLVQLEVVIEEIGTTIGKLPLYFVSRAAKLSGKK